MPPSATEALILSVKPYRETSALLTLFTKDFGRVSGIAKGIKRKKPTAVFPERGMIIETVLYLKQQEGLSLIGSLQVQSFPFADNPSLFIKALVDSGFEILQKILVLHAPHPEFYAKVLTWLNNSLKVTSVKNALNHLVSLLLYCIKHEGYELELFKCVSCKSDLALAGGGLIRNAEGGFMCPRCILVQNRENALTAKSMLYLQNPYNNQLLTLHDAIHIIKLLCTYIAFHAEKDTTMNALNFIMSMKWDSEEKEMMQEP